MALELDLLRALIAAHGPVVRVAVIGVRGSAPREVGTEMFVWPGGQSGTIGGGALEWRAVARAAQITAPVIEDWPLGPGLGQCCGGAVRLLWERFTQAPDALPYRRNIHGTLIEDHAPERPPVWVWGAGHVGRALVPMLAPLRAVTWVDFADVPMQAPAGVSCLPAASPAALVPHSPAEAAHVIVTRSHDLDLALCDGLLRHGARQIGLIGSATKWARFRSRLQAMGHEGTTQITCPIGDPTLGRAPQAIALGIAVALLKDNEQGTHS